MPRITPVAKMRAAVMRPPVRATSAVRQTAFQRLSVRYSIDFRKNGGKMRDHPRRPQHDSVERQHRRAHIEEDVVAFAEGL